MRMDIKTFSFLLSISLPFYALANSPINTADELHKHLTSGCNVHAIVDTHFCENSTPYGHGIFRVDFSIFNIYEIPQDNGMKKVIATSMSIPTHHRAYGLVLNYSRTRVSYDNSVEFFSESVDMKTGSSLESYGVNCHINKGVTLFSSC